MIVFYFQTSETGKVIDLNLCLGLICGLPPSLLKKRWDAVSMRFNSHWIAWLGRHFQWGWGRLFQLRKVSSIA